jgi:hypothetical protein
VETDPVAIPKARKPSTFPTVALKLTELVVTPLQVAVTLGVSAKLAAELDNIVGVE